MWIRNIGITLGIDNDTRWTSWCAIIENAVKKKDDIIKFLHEHADACGDTILTHQD
jgi:hypothetical protein